MSRKRPFNVEGLFCFELKSYENTVFNRTAGIMHLYAAACAACTGGATDTAFRRSYFS